MRTDKGALGGDEDERFDLGLEKFGVDTAAIENTPHVPKRYFKAFLEDWEKGCIKKKNDAVSKALLLKKYGGLVFEDIDNKIVYTINSEKLYWKPGKNGGWHILAEPPEYDGEDEDMLEIYEINEDCLIWLIDQYEQPKLLNVVKLTKESGDNSKKG